MKVRFYYLVNHNSDWTGTLIPTIFAMKVGKERAFGITWMVWSITLEWGSNE